MNIYVGNLSYDVTEDDLRQEFSEFGEVSSVNIIKDKFSGQSKGFAFVEMPVLQQGQAAVSELNGKKIKDRVINCSGARERNEGGGSRSFSRDNRRGGGGPGRGRGGGGRNQKRRY
jgi:RNA recognition motif-containing protein